MEAVGCKQCAQAVQAAEVKSKGCTACDGCSAVKQGECCGECAKSKHDTFASGCTGEVVPVKKAKKSKKIGLQDYYIVAPPAPQMPPHIGPIAISVPTSFLPTAMSVAMPPMPAPAQPMMVFRAASGAKATECKGCDSAVQQTKHETHGSITLGIGLNLAGVPQVHVETHGALEIDCGGCVASCEQMNLSMPGGKDWTIATTGKQVVVTGPSFKASCDTLARTTSEGAACFMLQGHVHLHHGKSGMKADIESEQVRLVIHDGMVEVQTVTAP
jgi:hypothetical protein